MHRAAQPQTVGAEWAAGFAGLHWTDVVSRAGALPALGREVLLHAGPPLHGRVPRPIWNAALQAAVYEGLAADPTSAGEAIRSGRLILRPAQDHGMATPLAQVVSASMPVAVVSDGDTTACAPLVESAAPALRFGQCVAGAGERLRQLDEEASAVLAPTLRRVPVALAPVVAGALDRGDECHARTAMANELLATQVSAGAALVQSNPGFVLPVLMAAALLRLRSQHEGIASVGGNGQAFGLRMHGETAWRVAPATPPRGTRLPALADRPALGAIGDSAVLDFCGLGAQAIGASPELMSEWGHLLPPDPGRLRECLLDPASGLVDARRVADSGLSPRVHLAIIDRCGLDGLLGRGFYEVPLDLFPSATR